ncbi:hypothetical protein [Streptomyces sp. SD15]
MLWCKEGPDAPASGADAPGMWITDKVVVKAAYKQVVYAAKPYDADDKAYLAIAFAAQ